MPSMVRLMYWLKSVLKKRETMLKKRQISFISVILKSWSGRKLLDPAAYCGSSILFTYLENSKTVGKSASDVELKAEISFQTLFEIFLVSTYSYRIWAQVEH